MMLLTSFVLMASASDVLGSSCKWGDWLLSFDKSGPSDCKDDSYYIRGFYRGDFNPHHDSLSLLEYAECCSKPSPWEMSKSITYYVDWWGILDSSHSWGFCPAGYFLQGLYRSIDSPGWLQYIEEGRCSRPADHPNTYGECYDEDIGICFDKRGLCKCKDGYFVTGLYRGGCNELKCLDKLRCCKMASAPEKLDEVYKVRARIMDTTLVDLANLASYLGYAWCNGCRATYVGEDFRRNGDTWVTDKSGRCSGRKNEQRLALAYGYWKFVIHSIVYGKPVTDELLPETIDQGILYNNDSTVSTKTVTLNRSVVRSITHTTTSWKNPEELGLVIRYKTPFTYTPVAPYKFEFANTTKVTDETSKEQTKTFTVANSNTVYPYTAASWKLNLFKTRTTVVYVATVAAEFSVDLQGFLRTPTDAKGNFHYLHSRSSSEPTVNYRFGGESTPFYTELRRQSEGNALPWQWHEMKSAHPKATDLITDLTNEHRYRFTVSGVFEDVEGTRTELRWDKVSPWRRSERDIGNATCCGSSEPLKIVARVGPNDRSPVNVTEPEVPIKEIHKVDNQRIVAQ